MLSPRLLWASHSSSQTKRLSVWLQAWGGEEKKQKKLKQRYRWTCSQNSHYGLRKCYVTLATVCNFNIMFVTTNVMFMWNHFLIKTKTCFYINIFWNKCYYSPFRSHFSWETWCLNILSIVESVRKKWKKKNICKITTTERTRIQKHLKDTKSPTDSWTGSWPQKCI